MKWYSGYVVILIFISSCTKHSGPSSVQSTVINLDSSFQSSNNQPEALSAVIQPDGKIVLGSLNGVFRVNADGTEDNSFTQPTLSSRPYIESIALQPDKKIVVGGFNISDQNGYLIRLNDDGSPDNSFSPITLQGLNGNFPVVRAVYAQPDGRIIVGGDFEYNSGGTAAYHLVRLNNDGSLDPTFVPNMAATNYGVHSIVPLSGGKFLFGGGMSASDAVNSRVNLIKLDGTGAIDPTFNFNYQLFAHNPQDAVSWINKVVIDKNGKILIGGDFLHIGTPTHAIGFNAIARVNADGTLDNTFITPSVGQEDVNDIFELNDGSLLVGRDANEPFPDDPGYITRLSATGQASSVSLGFTLGGITKFLQQSDKQLLLVGIFQIAGVSSTQLVRLNVTN